MKQSILWADDEIDLLKPHIIFLENKGYDLSPVSNGSDALDLCKKKNFDVVFLDENMPGLSGLETLQEIKKLKPNLPVVMITKSEEEHIMEDAIGSQISDYLIKPINPNQILLSVKKILDNKKLVSEKTSYSYQREFQQLSATYNDRLNHAQWAEVYKKLVYWELQIDHSDSKEMLEILEMQKNEAGAYFARFVMDHYEKWLNEPQAEKPLLSHQVVKKYVQPILQNGEKVFLLLIDNLRYDQWKVLESSIAQYFHIHAEDTYYSILPTTTEYARNAFFAGLMPSEIEKMYPSLWESEEGEESRNQHEEKLLGTQLKRLQLDIKYSYHKVLNNQYGKHLNDNLSNLSHNVLNAIVYNFVDMLSHARTEMGMLRELAPDESAYRSITHSWFQHSPLLELLRRIAASGHKVVLTTDHGTIRVKRPTKAIGNKETNTNLRFKTGKNLQWDDKEVFATRKPERFFLPKKHMTSSYIFAKTDYFIAYPNNFNYYVNYYKDTFQHGGISMEEMIIPVVVLHPK